MWTQGYWVFRFLNHVENSYFYLKYPHIKICLQTKQQQHTHRIVYTTATSIITSLQRSQYCYNFLNLLLSTITFRFVYFAIVSFECLLEKASFLFICGYRVSGLWAKSNGEIVPEILAYCFDCPTLQKLSF